MLAKVDILGSVIQIEGSEKEGYTFSNAGIDGMPPVPLFTASERGVEVRDGVTIGPHLTWLLVIACDVADAMFNGPEWSLEDVRNQVEECQPTPETLAEWEFRVSTGRKDTCGPGGFSYQSEVLGILSAEEKEQRKRLDEEDPN